MNKFEKFVNEFAEIGAMGLGINLNRRNDENSNSDDYIDYLG